MKTIEIRTSTDEQRRVGYAWTEGVHNFLVMSPTYHEALGRLMMELSSAVNLNQCHINLRHLDEVHPSILEFFKLTRAKH